MNIFVYLTTLLKIKLSVKPSNIINLKKALKTKAISFRVVYNKCKETVDKNKMQYNKSEIYEINCTVISVYIGKTKQSLNVRCKEHIQAYKSKKCRPTTMKSNYADHL